MEDKTEVPANLKPADEGFARVADGEEIKQSDEVQGPDDILTQYGQTSIPGNDVVQIERNRAAGLDATGYPIPGAVLSPAAQAVVDFQLKHSITQMQAIHAIEGHAPDVVVSVSKSDPTVENPAQKVTVPVTVPSTITVLDTGEKYVHASVLQRLLASTEHTYESFAAWLRKEL